MQITVTSFGFSHGAMEADYVFDLRFLPNPFWVAELKPYPGTDERIADYVRYLSSIRDRPPPRSPCTKMKSRYGRRVLITRPKNWTDLRV